MKTIQDVIAAYPGGWTYDNSQFCFYDTDKEMFLFLRKFFILYHVVTLSALAKNTSKHWLKAKRKVL